MLGNHVPDTFKLFVYLSFTQCIFAHGIVISNIPI